MKKTRPLIFIIAQICFHIPSYAQYASKNITLLSIWNDTAVVPLGSGQKYSGCFGYASNGREYAIIGSTDGTHFIEITDPFNPVRRDYVAGRRGSCIWREYKTYQNYLYAVSDDNTPNSFQIMDLSYLPDSVHVVHDDDTIFERAHTIYIDGNKLYAANVKGGMVGYAGMAVFSLANPEYPVLLRKIDDDYPSTCGAHDMFVRNDTVYTSCGNEGLLVFKFVPSANTFSMIGSLTSYENSGYNHSSFLTPDGKTLVFCDEVPRGLKAKVADVSDMTDLKVVSLLQSNTGATAHNPYMVGYKAVFAYYEDGIWIYDVSNPVSPVRTGYFDTYPQNGTTYSGYKGCWGAYTDLPSRNLVAGDMQNGLFVLDAKTAYDTILPPLPPTDTIPIVRQQIFPNPFEKNFRVDFRLYSDAVLFFDMTDILGRDLYSYKKFFPNGIYHETVSPPASLSNGVYFLKIRDEHGTLIKLVKAYKVK